MNITYELVKQLKEVGFPQRLGKYLGEKGTYHYGSIPEDLAYEQDQEDIKQLRLAYVPDLSELIDACGEEFDELSFEKICRGEDSYEDDWHCVGFKEKVIENNGYINTYGKTPEEAVAKLYIALNDTKWKQSKSLKELKK